MQLLLPRFHTIRQSITLLRVLQGGLEFIYTPLFESSVRGLLDEETCRALERTIIKEPRRGDLIPGSGGLDLMPNERRELRAMAKVLEQEL